MLMRMLRFFKKKFDISINNSDMDTTISGVENISPDSESMTSNEVKDYSLYSGERQPGKTLDEIREDHLVRYQLAEKLISSEFGNRICSGIDVFCGNGYGSFLLASNLGNVRIVGIDGSREAIDLANDCYSLSNNLFSYKLFPFELPENAFEFVTCFESLEHVEDDSSLLDSIIKSLRVGGLLMISVPNQEHHPLEKNPHHFHFRHYLHDDFMTMIPDCCVLEAMYGQNVYEFTSECVNTTHLLNTGQMALQKGIAGQINVYVFRKMRSH